MATKQRTRVEKRTIVIVLDEKFYFPIPIDRLKDEGGHWSNVSVVSFSIFTALLSIAHVADLIVSRMSFDN